MTKELTLTKGYVALIDNEDYEYLSRWKWTYSGGYALRKIKLQDKSSPLMLHRQIMNASEYMDVDHRDRNGLNNQRYNLRVCTRPQNSMNRPPKPNSSSQYKGVSFHKRDKIWLARLGINGKVIHLGCYDNEVEAALAYDKTAYEYFGEFAYLNFPE